MYYSLIKRISLYTFLVLLNTFFAFGQEVTIDFSNKTTSLKEKYTINHQQLFVELKESFRIDALKNKNDFGFEIIENRGRYLILKSKSKFSSFKEAESHVTKALGKENLAYIHPYLKAENGKMVSYLNEVLIKLKDGISEEKMKKSFKALAINVQKIIPHPHLKGYYNVVLMGEESGKTLEIAAQLLRTGHFDLAYPEIYESLELNTSDPLYFNQHNLNNTLYNDADIDADEAWSLATGSGIKVAVLDVGVALDHRDLDIQPNVGINFEDDGPDGGGPLQGETNSLGNLIDDHGTAIAGIIAAKTDNGLDIAGIAYNAEIIPIRVRSTFKADEAIGWAANTANADVIVMSFSASVNKALIKDAIEDAVQNGRGGKGCIFVGAAGNDGSSVVDFPASLQSVIAVGSTKMDDLRYFGSNYGTDLDLVAPGVGISSLNLSESQIWGYTGTSYATPHVAAVAAMVLEVNSDLTWQEVRHILNSTAERVGGYSYNFKAGKPSGTWNMEMGYGRLNAKKAVDEAINTCFVTLDDGTVYTGSPQALTNPASTICAGALFQTNSYSLPVSPGATSYQLTSNSDYFSIVNETPEPGEEIILLSGTPGTYTLTLTTSNDCGSSQASINVTVENCEGGFLFTPFPNTASTTLTIAPTPNMRTFNAMLQNSTIANNKGSTKDSYEIYNLKAEVVASGYMSNFTQVPVSDLKSGHYILKINYRGQVEQHRIIIE